ncbi:penicillin-binding protein 1A [Candidatus Nitrospira bockiana]
MSYPDLFEAPNRRRRWPWWAKTLIVLVSFVLLVGLAGAGAVWYIAQDLPSLDSVTSYQPSLVSRVYSDDRQMVGQFFVERRILTPLADIPQHFIQAVIAVEDVRFFEHPGLDVVGIARAAWTNLRRGGKVEGASTITQQLARALLLSPERTYMRKLKELLLAYKMETVLSKEQILETYLNQIYFGQGAYGVRAAVQTYFGKPLAELTLPEAALLAGLPKSPNNYSPYRNPERAKKRQEHVLARMEEAGFIDAQTRQDAAAQTLTFRHGLPSQTAPYFMEYVRQHVMAKFGETAVYKGGLEIFTTMNLALQEAAEQAVRNRLRQLDKRQGWRGPLRTAEPVKAVESTSAQPDSLPKPGEIREAVVTKVGKDHVLVQVGTLQGKLLFDDMAWAKRRLRGKDLKDVTVLPTVKGLVKPGDVIEVSFKAVDRDTVLFQLDQTPVVEGALVAIDPRTGAIRAMVGGYDFSRSEFNRTVLAHRQPGSAFKPIIYATAFNAGLSPATMVLDTPVVYEQQDDPDKTWKPENYGKRFYGATSLRNALTHSHNLATVRLLERIGVKSVVDFSRMLGISSPLNHDLSLALGSSSVTLLELTSAYGVFANQGLKLDPYAVALVQDPSGQILEQALFAPRQAIPAETAYLITNVLEDVVQHGTGQQAKSLGRPLAGKTGTTNDYTDAWFIGYTPNLVVGVWVGFDDIRSLGETESGARAALPIWIDFMRQALAQLPEIPFEIPENILFVRIDAETGLLAADHGEAGTVEIFAKGTEPTQTAPPRVDSTRFYQFDQEPLGGGSTPAVQIQ